MSPATPIKTPERFAVYWIDLDPTTGHEIRKTHPCVIISPDIINCRLNTVIVAPLTSTIRDFPCRLPLSFNKKRGEIALDQMRCIDKSRLGKYMGQLSGAVSETLLLILTEMFAP